MASVVCLTQDALIPLVDSSIWEVGQATLTKESNLDCILSRALGVWATWLPWCTAWINRNSNLVSLRSLRESMIDV